MILQPTIIDIPHVVSALQKYVCIKKARAIQGDVPKTGYRAGGLRQSGMNYNIHPPVITHEPVRV